MVREGWDLRIPQPSLSLFTHLFLYRVGGECCPAYQAIWIPTRQLWETAEVPAMCRGLYQLHGCHTLPSGGGPSTAGSSDGLPGLLHAGCLPEHAGLLPLPPEQGKEGPTSPSCTHVLSILGP